MTALQILVRVADEGSSGRPTVTRHTVPDCLVCRGWDTGVPSPHTGAPQPDERPLDLSEHQWNSPNAVFGRISR
jgi:hypothetical protein